MQTPAAATENNNRTARRQHPSGRFFVARNRATVENLQLECPLSVADPINPPLLSYAVARDKADWAQWLLQRGADADKQIDSESVREYAARLGRAKLLADSPNS